MNILSLDWETHFSDQYTVKKLTTEHYIRHPDFEPLLLGVRDENGEYFYLEQPEIGPWLKRVDWSRTAILAHHAHFDGFILSHHYGAKPCMWFDTLSMAKLMIGNHLSVALASLAQHYGLEGKSVPYEAFKGKRWAQLDAWTRKTLGEGCIHDLELTWAIFQELSKGFPVEEYLVIDMTIRMFTEPHIIGDQKLFERVRDEEWSKKNELLINLGLTTKDLQSAGKFAALLEAEGVEVEYKSGKDKPDGSPTYIPAIAATDDFMKGLVEHGNDRVADLASARLEVRSTIDETRAGRLANMASRGPMPVYLAYCAAHTTRWGGGDKVNFQNFRRSGDLRKGLRAPKGFKFGIVDLSQIECRILNYVAGQWDIVDAFASGRDLYSEGASRFYGREVTKANKLERHLGKVLELGCGYGMGATKLQATCRAGALGGPPILLDAQEAAYAIDVYRSSHAQVKKYWYEGDRMLGNLAGGWGNGTKQTQWGPLIVEPGRIVHADSGIPMMYQLEYDTEEGSWRRRTRRGWVRIWGGGLVENVVQFMARIVMSRAMTRITQGGCRIVMTTHDEIVTLIPDDQHAEANFQWVCEQMKQEPAWLPGIPLEVEGSLSEVYDK